MGVDREGEEEAEALCSVGRRDRDKEIGELAVSIYTL